MSGFHLSRSRKILMFVLIFVIAFPLLFLSKWYATTTRAEISATRGVYGMDGMEIWIDINARMPTPLRLWACNTLLAREKVAMGGRNSWPPHSCQPDFDTATRMPTGDSNTQILAGFANNSAQQALARGASTEQQTQVYDCVLADLTNSQSGFSDTTGAARQAAQAALGQAFQDATKACMAQAGL
jgi:hypothetical protein